MIALSNPYSPPESEAPDSTRDELAPTRVPKVILLWASVGCVAHGLLALNWLVFTWAWMVPYRGGQILVSLIGLGIHAFAFPMVNHQDWKYPSILTRGWGTAYLAFAILLFVGSVGVTSQMTRRDEVRYQEHMKRLKELQSGSSLESAEFGQ